jgi:hypothetical protein
LVELRLEQAGMDEAAQQTVREAAEQQIGTPQEQVHPSEELRLERTDMEAE